MKKSTFFFLQFIPSPFPPLLLSSLHESQQHRLGSAQELLLTKIFPKYLNIISKRQNSHTRCIFSDYTGFFLLRNKVTTQIITLQRPQIGDRHTYFFHNREPQLNDIPLHSEKYKKICSQALTKNAIFPSILRNGGGKAAVV